MMKNLSYFRKGFGLFIALVLLFLSNVAFASDYGWNVPDPYVSGSDYWKTYGPNTDDTYFYFGDDELLSTSSNGIKIELDETSMSYQSIRAVVTLPVGLIEARGIDKFHILVNGNKKIDEFDPHQSNWEDSFRRYYLITINVTDDYISSRMYFQIIGTASSNDGEYVVAWSGLTQDLDFKDLPVVDTEAISWLQAIYNKLDELLSSLSNLLSEINESIKKIYEIEPETQERFDNALSTLKSKLPQEQLNDEFNHVKDLMDESVDKINNADQHITFGEIHWMNVYTSSALDFTEYMEYIEKLRTILKVALWIEFFYFVIRILVPKLTA